MAGRNAKDLIDGLDGERLVDGVVKIPVRNSLVFEDILKKNKMNYVKKDILELI